MPVVFASPTSRPSSLGDGYTLYKKSIIPVVPVVDTVVLEEGEVPESVDKIDKDDESDEQDGKRKASEIEESSGSEAPETKKPREEESSTKNSGEGESVDKNTGSGEGSAIAAVPAESTGDEPKVGDKGVSVPTEPERDHAKQETIEASSSSEV